MTAYYNEFDPHAAQWLRNLIAAGVIAPGDVDERSIEDVTPNDLRGYTQCHFFAGIGGWAYALGLAGWPRDRPVWTGSCPCQPFSAAGKGAGFEDERHLWPAWQHLINQCRPPVIFGEQVASKAVDAWIDLVHTDMEGMGYAFGSIPFPAAGVGAPHIRDRNYWLGHANGAELEGHAGNGGAAGRQGSRGSIAQAGLLGGLAHADSGERDGFAVVRGDERDGTNAGRTQGGGGIAACSDDGRLADAEGCGRSRELLRAGSGVPQNGVAKDGDTGGRPGPTNGQWRDSDWLGCRDGKWRPVEARSLALVDGLSNSLGLVCAAAEAARKEIDDWCSETKVRAGKALLDVRMSLESESVQVRAIGGSDGLPSATVLLAFLRKLQAEGWHVEEGVPRSGAQAEEASLRGVQYHEEAMRSPRERGLDEQRASEPTDPVRVLSSILARHAQAAWPQAITADAEVGFPIGAGSTGRIGRLRAYGNAINPYQAAEFVAAFMNADVRQELAAA